MELKNNLFNNLFYKILIMCALFVFFFYALKYLEKKPASTVVTIASTTIYAQVADSENERSLGLSFTKAMDENTGMLFVFEETSVKNFWMRDMLFDLDIIWLDEEKKVMGFFENVSKDSYNIKNPEFSRIFHSPETTKYVLELNAGNITKLKIKVGDLLDFKY